MNRAKYSRSTTYRYQFIKANPPDSNGLYRCAYCGKKISPEEMTVDHVIPVSAGKYSLFARWKLRKMDSINDLKNLCPTCERCNLKKGASFSLVWRWKAWLGQKKWYWEIRKLMVFLILIFIAFCIDTGFLVSFFWAGR